MAPPRITIDELPLKAEPADTDLVLIHDTGVSRHTTVAGLRGASEAGLAAHIADPTDAHDASAVSATDSGNSINSPTVQGQLGQLSGLSNDIAVALTVHIVDNEGAHAASAISFAETTEIPEDNVQDALGNLAAQVDTVETTISELELGTVDSVVAGTNVTIDSTDPRNPVISSSGGGGGGDGIVESVVAGSGIIVDSTDPANPIITATGGGGGGGAVDEVVAGTGIEIDDTDPTAPVVALANATIDTLALIPDLDTTHWRTYTDPADARVGTGKVEVWMPSPSDIADPENAALNDIVLRTTPGLAQVFVHDGSDYEATNVRIFVGPNPTAETPVDGDQWIDPTAGAQYVWWEGEWVPIIGDAPEPEAPDQVTGLVATPGDSTVGLVWVAPAPNGSSITAYVVERAPDVAGSPGSWATLDSGVAVLAYDDNTAVNDTIYWYRVSATNGIGTGLPSDPVDATPTAPPGSLINVVEMLDSTPFTLVNNPTVTFSAGLLENDIVVICSTTDTNASLWGTYDTSYATAVNGAVLSNPPGNATVLIQVHRVTSAEETAETVTFGLRCYATTEDGSAFGFALRGVDVTTAVDAFNTSTGTVEPYTLAALPDTMTTGAKVYSVYANDVNMTMGPPDNGWALLETGAGANHFAGLYGHDDAVNGVAIPAGTIDGSVVDGWCCISVAFRPAP